MNKFIIATLFLVPGLSHAGSISWVSQDEKLRMGRCSLQVCAESDHGASLEKSCDSIRPTSGGYTSGMIHSGEEPVYRTGSSSCYCSCDFSFVGAVKRSGF